VRAVVVAEPPSDQGSAASATVLEISPASLDLYADNLTQIEAAFVPGHDEQIGPQIVLWVHRHAPSQSFECRFDQSGAGTPNLSLPWGSPPERKPPRSSPQAAEKFPDDGARGSCRRFAPSVPGFTWANPVDPVRCQRVARALAPPGTAASPEDAFPASSSRRQM